MENRLCLSSSYWSVAHSYFYLHPSSSQVAIKLGPTWVGLNRVWVGSSPTKTRNGVNSIPTWLLQPDCDPNITNLGLARIPNSRPENSITLKFGLSLIYSGWIWIPKLPWFNLPFWRVWQLLDTYFLYKAYIVYVLWEVICDVMIH